MTLQLLPCPSCERVTALTVAVRPDDKLRCPHCGGEFLFSTLFREPRACWEIVPRNGQPKETAGIRTIDETVESAGALTLSMTDAASQAQGRDTIYDSHDLYRDIVVPNDGSSQYAQEEIDGHVQFSDEPQDEPHHNSAPEISASHGLSEVGLSEDDDDELGSPNPTLAKKTEWSQFQPLTPELYDRQRRARRRSPIWPVIQVALGGVAAVPIALLLVWHLLGTDVGEAGPWVGKYIPWIVPEKYRPYQSLTPSRTFRTALDSPISSPGAASGLPRVDSQELASESDPATLETTNPAPSPAEVNTPLAVPAGAVERRLPLTSPTSGGVSEVRTSEAVPVGTDTNTPLYENVLAIIRQTTEHIDDYAAAARRQDVDLRSLAPATYRDLTNLALVIDRLPPESTALQAVRRQLKPLGQQLVDDAELRRLVGLGAPYWVNSQASLPKPSPTLASEGAPDRSEQTEPRFGLAMIVTVEQAEEISSATGAWWQIAASTGRLGEPAIEIRVPQDVALTLSGGEIAPQQNLFLLGTVGGNVENGESGSRTAPARQIFVAQYVIAF